MPEAAALSSFFLLDSTPRLWGPFSPLGHHAVGAGRKHAARSLQTRDTVMMSQTLLGVDSSCGFYHTGRHGDPHIAPPRLSLRGHINRKRVCSHLGPRPYRADLDTTFDLQSTVMSAEIRPSQKLCPSGNVFYFPGCLGNRDVTSAKFRSTEVERNTQEEQTPPPPPHPSAASTQPPATVISLFPTLTFLLDPTVLQRWVLLAFRYDDISMITQKKNHGVSPDFLGIASVYVNVDQQIGDLLKLPRQSGHPQGNSSAETLHTTGDNPINAFPLQGAKYGRRRTWVDCNYSNTGKYCLTQLIFYAPNFIKEHPSSQNGDKGF